MNANAVRFTAAIGLGLALLAFGVLTKGGAGESPLMWSGAGIALGGAIGVATSILRPAAGAAPALPAHDYLPASVTVGSLYGVMSSRMQMQAQTELAPNVGRWMVVSVRVDNVGPAGGFWITVFPRGVQKRGLAPNGWLKLCFDPGDAADLATLKRGQAITVAGCVHSIDLLGLFLKDCVIVQRG